MRIQQQETGLGSSGSSGARYAPAAAPLIMARSSHACPWSAASHRRPLIRPPPASLAYCRPNNDLPAGRKAQQQAKCERQPPAGFKMQLKVVFLAVGMLFFGTINTITVKFQVRRWLHSSNAPSPRQRRFQTQLCSGRMQASEQLSHLPVPGATAPTAPTACPNRPQDIVVVGSAADGTAITFKHPVVQVRRSFLPCWWLMLEAEIKPLPEGSRPSTTRTHTPTNSHHRAASCFWGSASASSRTFTCGGGGRGGRLSSS